MTTIRKAVITEVSVHKVPEMDAEATIVFKDIVKNGLALKTSMKALHPTLVRIKLINGDETHDEINENKELKLLILANLAAQLPDRIASSGYGQGKISLFDLYKNKTEDQLIAFFNGKKIAITPSELDAIKKDGNNLYQWLRRLRDETINSWDLAGKPSKAASRANAAATKKAAVQEAVEALVGKRTTEQAAAADESQDETLSDVTGTIGESHKKNKRKKLVKGITQTLIDKFPAIEQGGIFLVVSNKQLYCLPPDMLHQLVPPKSVDDKLLLVDDDGTIVI